MIWGALVLFFLYCLYISLINFLAYLKKYNILNKKGYIDLNTNFAMNLKERGITVGDLLIIFIIIITSSILVKSFNKDKKTTLNHVFQEHVSQKTYCQNLI